MKLSQLQDLLKIPDIDAGSGNVREQIAQAAKELAQQTLKDRLDDIVGHVIEDINNNFDHYMVRVRDDIESELGDAAGDTSADLKHRAAKYLQLKALQNDELWGAVMHISKTAIQNELNDLKHEIANYI